MFIFVFLRPAEPYSGLSGNVSISCTAPFPSAGRVVPMRITQLVYWPLVTLYSLEFTLFLILQWLSCRPGYGSQGAENSRKSSSAPPCTSVAWFTFLAVLPFISVRPSRRREAQAEGLLRSYALKERHLSCHRILWISEACNRSQAKPPCSCSFTLQPCLVSCHLVKLPVSALMCLPSF